MNGPNRNFQKYAGFTMVELMVALVIGLILLAGISSVFITSKRNYTTQDSQSRMQENARVALQIMTREIRGAGYFGCADSLNSITNTIEGAASSNDIFDTAVPLQGADNGGNLFPDGSVALPAATSSDGIAIKYLDNSLTISLDRAMPTSAAALPVSGDTDLDLKVGDIVMVSDCNSGAVFQVSGPGNEGDSVSSETVIVHNSGTSVSPGNKTKNLGKIYDTDAVISKFYTIRYYIAPGASGQPALWRERSGTQEELVEGIEAMHILYGVDGDADNIPDRYLPAGGSLQTINDWRNVVSVRLGIVARALASKTTVDDKLSETNPDLTTLDVDGDGAADFDPSTLSVTDQRYHRRVFRTTILLRNL